MLIAPGTKPTLFYFDDDYRKSLQTRPVKWNTDGLSEFTFIRTYARTKENGKLESWNDCVIRVIEGQFSILKTYAKINHIPWDEKRGQKLSQEAADRMFCFKWLPPGRGLWMMGCEFMWSRGGAALNNCYFVSTKDVGKSIEETTGPFTFLMDMSMLGGGVGFDTRGAQNNVFIQGYSSETEVFQVPDTREGWVEAYGKAIQYGIFGGPKLELDVSLVRGPGQPIKGFGGISSGPAPLIMLIKGVIDILQNQRLTILSSVTITDLMNLAGKCVVSGNVRRSSEIAFSDPGDSAFANMKRWDLHPVEMDSRAPDELKEECEEDYNLYNANIWDKKSGIKGQIINKYFDRPWAYKFGGWRQASNNSLFAKVGMDYKEYEESIKLSGEPGFNWLDLVRKFGRFKDPEDNRDYRVDGANPCQPDFALLLTPKGITTMGDVSVGDTIWSGTQWTKIKRKIATGIKKVQVYHTTAGRFVGTSQHKVFQKGERIQVKNAEAIDRNKGPSVESVVIDKQDVMDGLVIGDAFVHKASNNLICLIIGKNDSDINKYMSEYILSERSGVSKGAHEIFTTIKHQQLKALPNRKIPIKFLEGSPSKVCGFLRGLYSANGSIVGGRRVALKATSFHIIQAAQAMLSSVGINSYYTTNKPTKVKFSNGTYECKQSYDLNISTDIAKFATLIGFIHDYKTKKLNKVLKKVSNTGTSKETYEIKDIEYLGKMPVYDIEVEAEEHSYWTDGLLVSNCNEQGLESYEGCNLVEDFPVHCDNYWDFQRTLKFSYLYAKCVTLMGTHVARTNAIIIRNRRIGCSISGITDAIAKFGRTKFFTEFCDKGYNYVKYIDHKYSDWLGIPESIKKTTVKPSGTTSLVAGVNGPGVHFAKIKYGYRLIRFPANSPLASILKASNYRVESELRDPNNTLVVYFPIICDDKIVAEDETTIWEKFKMAADMQYWWSDNLVSCTVEFTKNEADKGEISRCLEAFDGQLKGISLLSASEGNYQQMPYTKAPREEVLAYRDNLFPLDFSSLTEEGENAEALKFCDGDHCLV